MFGFALAVAILTGCGQRQLLSNVSASADVISPNGDGVNDSVSISYAIGAPAKVSVFIQDKAGKRYPLRTDAPRVPSSDPYTLRFDGTVQGSTPNVRQQVLPNGDYTWIVSATPMAGGAAQTQSGRLKVEQAAAQLPQIEDLNVTPQFSPNEDAVDDVAYFTYRLPISATVSINLADPNGGTIPLLADVAEGPYAQSHVWDGKRPDGSLVSSGAYTYTITARDAIGNITQRQGQIAVTQPGRSDARVTFVDIAPVEVGLGDVITVTARIKNTGNVPIRTQGPASGYQYSTNTSFSSIENEKYAEKGGGFWRVGLDWGGGRSYPFRWALSSRTPDKWAEPYEYDYLQPGEEVEVTGSVRIEQREDRMEFYVGLVHEGVGYPVNNVGRTLICVGIPGVQSKCPYTKQP